MLKILALFLVSFSAVAATKYDPKVANTDAFFFIRAKVSANFREYTLNMNMTQEKKAEILDFLKKHNYAETALPKIEMQKDWSLKVGSGKDSVTMSANPGGGMMIDGKLVKIDPAAKFEDTMKMLDSRQASWNPLFEEADAAWGIFNKLFGGITGSSDQSGPGGHAETESERLVNDLNYAFAPYVNPTKRQPVHISCGVVDGSKTKHLTKFEFRVTGDRYNSELSNFKYVSESGKLFMSSLAFNDKTANCTLTLNRDTSFGEQMCGWITSEEVHNLDLCCQYGDSCLKKFSDTAGLKQPPGTPPIYDGNGAGQHEE
jgi:hypothetical protein